MATLSKTGAGYFVKTSILGGSRSFTKLKDAQAHYRKVDALERKRSRR